MNTIPDKYRDLSRRRNRKAQPDYDQMGVRPGDCALGLMSVNEYYPMAF